MIKELRDRLNLTEEQEEILCFIIGYWYIEWKDKMVEYDTRCHRLGYAKEQLKLMICRSEKDEK